MDDVDENVVQTIQLSGFDPQGEPVVRVMRDGTIAVAFEFMPPSWHSEADGDPEELGPFEDFDRRMGDAIGAEVAWQDRELFIVEEPRDDTIQRIRSFLSNYPRP